MSKILVIEDEIAINKMLCLNLGITGYETIAMYDGRQVIDWLNSGERADLALVDVMLPKVDGFALLEPLKARHIPCIFLTARGDLESKLKGLTAGAEDYIVKPFEILEVLVRIEKVLKRYGREDAIIQLGDIQINTKKRSVQKGEALMNLTPIEFDLLVILARNRNLAMGREKLLAEIWGIDFEGETRTVDVHVASLRKKTGLRIVSIPKIGYRLEAEEY